MNDDNDDRRHDEPVTPLLAAARDDLRARRAPDWIESRLLTAAAEQRTLKALEPPASPVDARRIASRPWWRRAWLAPALAGSAAFVIGVGVLTMQPVAIGPAAAAAPTPFIALAPMDTLDAEAAPQIVAAQMPRAALADFGLPVDPARADRPVQTEFLISPRGVVLAVRFVE